MKILDCILVLMLILGVSACSALKEKAGCYIEDKVVGIAADVVVEKLQCANSFAVHADVKAVVDKIGLCPTGPIGDVACPLVAREVVSKLVSVAVPPEWKCSAQDAKDTLQSLIESTCKSVVPVKNLSP